MVNTMQTWKKKYWNNRGFAMIFAMGAIIVAMVLLALLGVYFQQNLYSASLQQINAKAYYLAKQSADLVSAALIENTDLLTNPTEQKETFTHYDATGTNELGTSVIAMKNETIDGEDWKVVRITTTIPDFRTDSKGVQNEPYKYYYRMHVSRKDPLARLNFIDDTGPT